jgi:hypothetical protein
LRINLGPASNPIKAKSHAMSDLVHVEVLRAGPRAWNTWRRENPGIVPDLNDLKVSVSERQFARVQGGPIDLRQAELRRAGLDQATLIEANLRGATLIDADLSDARLEKADLCGANLCNAKLAYATLNGARLDAAMLCGADLRHARGLTQAQIDRALGDRRTALPASLTMPRGWIHQSQPVPAQLGEQTASEIDDYRASPYATLGLKPGASTQEIRAAWRKLVKELHPDRWGESPASERLKAINRAYQRLKIERYTTQRRAARPFVRDAKVVFAAFFLLAIAAGALVVGVQNYVSHPRVVTREADPAAGTSIAEGEIGSPTARRGMSSAPSGQPSTDEPFVGADWRLR